MSSEDKATEIIKRRWNRTAWYYDYLMAFMDRVGVRKGRRLLWSRVESSHVLEIGVGTGNNFSCYPPDAEMAAIDFSEGMLKRAKERASRHKVKVDLQQMDVQNLKFADNTFNTVAATLVFCSVPDPVRGIKEVARVCKQGGKVILLENDFSSVPVISWLAKLANPLAVRMIGADFTRRPMDHVATSGLAVERVTSLRRGLWKLIETRKV
jgi:phosphatidylethanolamine/phosphatidyl-N-methylethanolamine N-methyltransferase